MLGVGGLSLGSFLRMSEAGEVKPGAKAKSVILIYLSGGPSHMDTFDLKPNAPSEYRGLFNPIKTNVPGIEISEHLPKMAKQADKYAILRGVSHTLAAHRFGKQYMNTGNRPLPSLVFPSYGAVISKELGGEIDLPTSVAVPKPSHPAGYLGVAHGALSTGRTPQVGQKFGVRGMSLQNGLTIADLEKRQNLLNDLDTVFAGQEKNSSTLAGMDKFSRQAYEMISSSRARTAFDISKESPAAIKEFGDDPFGQSCLLATRLVEAGVKFVNVDLGGWDTHSDNFGKLKDTQLPKLDTGLAALFNQLDARGLLESTTVMVTGEFGRTPKINTRSTPGGRDHYPRAMFVLLGGGGMKGGQVVGASDEKAAGPANDAISPDSIAKTVYHSLGINTEKEYRTASGRPVMIVRNGSIIREMFS